MAIDILLVDDSAVMRKVLTRALRQGGLDIGEIHEAGDGTEALEQVTKGGISVSLVLCDWNMPNMNGPDFVQEARNAGFEAPVIMVTTEGGDERIAQATEAGANGFICKPFTPDKLADAINSVLAPA